MANKLKCTSCSEDLVLSTVFDGCDEASIQGAGSGFDFEVRLVCENCGRVYPIGRIKNEYSFCENVPQRRAYCSHTSPTTILTEGSSQTPCCK